MASDQNVVSVREFRIQPSLNLRQTTVYLGISPDAMHFETPTMLALFQLPCTEVMAPAIRFNFTVILNDTTNSLN
jgi:hypothetical protein